MDMTLNTYKGDTLLALSNIKANCTRNPVLITLIYKYYRFRV